MQRQRVIAFFLTLIMALSLAAASLAENIKLPMDFSGGMPVTEKFSTGKMVYEDPSIRVERTRVESKEWVCTYYTAHITIADASQLRTESAKGFNSNGRVHAETIAKRVNAVLAINGDYFSGRSGSYVFRQGQMFREEMDPGQDVLLIDEDGDFHIIMAEDHPESMDKTVVDGKKVVNALCFGPAMVKDGQKVLNLDHEQRNTHGLKRAQRICIAQLGPLEYLVVCCAHYGMNLSDFTDLVMSLGDVKQAYNLDGGNSTYMMFLGHKVNNTEAGSPRLLADIIYFASAYVEDGAAQ